MVPAGSSELFLATQTVDQPHNGADRHRFFSVGLKTTGHRRTPHD